MQDTREASSAIRETEGESLAMLSRLAGQRFGTTADATQSVLTSITSVLGMRTSWVARADFVVGDLKIVAAHNEPNGCDVQVASTTPLPRTLCSMVVSQASPRPLIIEDLHSDLGYMNSSVAKEFPGIGSYVGVPIVLSDATVFGTLCASDPEPRRISTQQVELLTVLSRLLATQIERDIESTARRRAEDQYRLLAERGTDVLQVIDADGRATYTSPSVARVLGYAPEDYARLSRMPACVLVHPDDRARHDAAYEQARSGHEQSTEVRYRTKREGDRWMEVTFGSLTSDTGHWLGTRAQLRDVHDAHVAQASLRASERRFYAFMDNGPMVAYMKSATGHYLYVNSPFERTFGVDLAWLSGKTDDDWLRPEEAAAVRENDRNVLATNEATEFLESLRLTDDELRYWYSFKFPFTDAAGRVLLGGISIDITERRKQEIEHGLLAAIVHDSQDAIYGKTSDGIVTSWNPAAERLYGYQAGEMIGRSLDRLIPPGQTDDLRELTARVCDGERIEMHETQRQPRDGPAIDVALTISPIRDPEGEIVGASTIARDVTERKRLIEERQQLYAELQAEIHRAAEIQAHLLPRYVPILPGYEFAAVCLPAREVGGDFFDWNAGRERVRLSLGDVTGKGMSAALLMATARAGIRSIVDRPVAKVLTAVNRALGPDLEQSDSFITLFHAELESNGRLSYSDAGHGLAMIIWKDGTLEPLQQQSLPLGILPETIYQESTTWLEPGDTLIVYSDGLPDAREDLDLSDPAKVAAYCANETDVNRMLERLVDLASGDGPRPDDLTLILIHRKEESL